MAIVRAAFTASLPALGRVARGHRLAAAAAAARPARAAAAASPRRGGATMAAAPGSLADLGTVTDIDGAPLPLAGRPTLVVNVASECGYTASGYQQMKDVLAKYGDRVAVVAVPCNAFGMCVGCCAWGCGPPWGGAGFGCVGRTPVDAWRRVGEPRRPCASSWFLTHCLVLRGHPSDFWY